MLPLLLAACAELPSSPLTFPAPDAWTREGPGAPATSFAEGDLFQPCAYLTGGPEDVDHHNLVVMVDGWLLLPWAPEFGGGGLSFYDVSDPCHPVKVGEGFDARMRESHTIGLQLGESRYAAVDYLEPDGSGGVGVWDITDVTAPRWVSQIALPYHTYPDSYTRLTLSVTWQGPYIFASTTGLGVYVIDASDPLDLQLAGQITFEGPHIVGSFPIWGNTAMAASAGLSRTVMMDVSDPLAATPLPGGDFNTLDPEGTWRPYYFSNVGSHYGLYARSKDGGGPMVYDLADPTAPVAVSRLRTPEGDGGYIFLHNDRLFVGDSAFGDVYDFTDPAVLVPLGRFLLQGDLDTVTPMSNVAVVSVDEKGVTGQSSAVIPWDAEPDVTPPSPGMTSPRQGEVFVATTARVGVVFDEMIEPVSAFSGSFRVFDDRDQAVPGAFNVQENVVNFTPDAPLREDAGYTVHLPAGGLADLSGNRLADDLRLRFWTGPAR
ncbi:MAG TPA: Ig-like domain-containing protein [Myxococcota bacterium]|nr:Ig-like domain-containing protein [Myxococcota bacterium]